ncbi:MAG: hypothetical protein IJR68_07605, partial [Fretibacterium sp.]|nr:hypothetical protein [Fretibacterium sp.]
EGKTSCLKSFEDWEIDAGGNCGERRPPHGGDTEDSAIARAITDMPDDFFIKPFLMAHRAEVKGMLLTEYNEAETMELFKEEGREEGRKEGRKEGRMEGQLEKAKQAALNLLRIGKLTLAEIAESVGLPMAEIQKIAR